MDLVHCLNSGLDGLLFKFWRSSKVTAGDTLKFRNRTSWASFMAQPKIPSINNQPLIPNTHARGEDKPSNASTDKSPRLDEFSQCVSEVSAEEKAYNGFQHPSLGVCPFAQDKLETLVFVIGRLMRETNNETRRPATVR